MSKELATVRDLMNLTITVKFDVRDKDILQRLQCFDYYIKDEPIYKEDLDKLISDMQDDAKNNAPTNFSESYSKNGFIYAPIKDCKYTINTDGIFEDLGVSNYFQIIISFNKKTFCKFTFDDDSIFVHEGKYLAYLDNVTHYIHADTKEILYSASLYNLASIYYNFQTIMQSCYKYLNSITDLTDEQILSLWHIAIGHHYEIFPDELKTNSKIMQEIFDKINKDSFTQISYKEYKDKMDVHITKSIMQGAAKRIPITAYNLITNEIPYDENISSLDNYVNLTEYIENQYKAPKDKPLKDFIKVDDLEFYPYWKKE